uniref:Putative secreted protein n=1 Tax=Anopheles darlingi TaxID=43151 RepID=A0A2M4DGX5_ANODA
MGMCFCVCVLVCMCVGEHAVTAHIIAAGCPFNGENDSGAVLALRRSDLSKSHLKGKSAQEEGTRAIGVEGWRSSKFKDSNAERENGEVGPVVSLIHLHTPASHTPTPHTFTRIHTHTHSRMISLSLYMFLLLLFKC